MFERICRTCLREITTNDFIKLNNSTQSLEVQAELLFCIPEVNFDLIEDSYMCHECINSLHSSYLFKNECLRSEERIRNYVKLKNGGNITLSDLKRKNRVPVEELMRNSKQNFTFEQGIVDDLNSILDEVLKQDVNSNQKINLNTRIEKQNGSEGKAKDNLFKDDKPKEIKNHRKKSVVKITNLKLLPGVKQFVCSFCNKFFRLRHLLNIHTQTFHQKQIQNVKRISFPKIVFPLNKNKKNPKNTPNKRHTNVKVSTHEYKCNVCNYVGKRRDYVKDHIKRQHDYFEIVPCEINGSKCHILEILKCTFCDFVGDRDEIQSHTNVVHVEDILIDKNYSSTIDPEMNKFICSICNKGFCVARDLKLHILKHITLYSCSDSKFTLHDDSQEAASHNTSMEVAHCEVPNNTSFVESEVDVDLDCMIITNVNGNICQI